MRTTNLLIAVLAGQALSSPVLESRDLSSFIATEKLIALKGVLANIGADGSLSSGASSGIVIASPSTVRFAYPKRAPLR